MQNNMLRVIHGLRMVQCVSMQRLSKRENKNDAGKSEGSLWKYSTLVIHNFSSEKIKKFIKKDTLRKNAKNFIRVPENL